jgi:hypothetical protein
MPALEDLAFVEREPWDLLGLHPGRALTDAEHAEFGWCRLAALRLEDASGAVVRVERPLVLALHSRDDAPPRADDIELEFVLRDADGEYSATAPLSEFLRRRAPPLLAGAEAVVLALCNPGGARVARPVCLGERPLHYGIGDVTAYMRRRAAGPWRPDNVSIFLTAERWVRT